MLDRLRETVCLAGGLREDGTIDDDAAERALACLARFGQRISDLGADRVRAVGTHTLRKASKSGDFRERAEAALGHQIEVIAGSEEARLIYLGVCHGIAGAPARRLVLDIGGGSTECIVGDGFTPVTGRSLYMGCVSFTDAFLTAARSRKSDFARPNSLPSSNCSRLLQTRRFGWERAIGASGTVRAVRGIVHANGWGDDTITPTHVDRIREQLLRADRLKLDLPGLSDDRKPVFAAGVAILRALMSDLRIEELTVSNTALREGLLYDLLGRHQDEDPRDRTIEMFAQRYVVDRHRRERVENRD
ncbi:MAG: Ppx/GppA family phosphatase [Polyangiales bacterium]